MGSRGERGVETITVGAELTKRKAGDSKHFRGGKRKRRTIQKKIWDVAGEGRLGRVQMERREEEKNRKEGGRGQKTPNWGEGVQRALRWGGKKTTHLGNQRAKEKKENAGGLRGEIRTN